LLLEGLETRLTPAPVITTIAGTASYGYNGDGIPGTAATLYLPFGTAVDSSGNVFIADSYNSRIREVVKATGNITTVAGTGNFGYNGDGGPATLTTLYHPDGVALDAGGNLFIADTFNNRIREVVKSTGAMITVAGNGSTGFSGDGGPATAAMLNAPFGVAVDGSGNVFFSDQGNNRVREVLKATGQIITVAGTGTAGYNGDNIPAASAMLNQPNGVAVDGGGNVFISDWHNSRIREVVAATGTIITFAGTGSVGFSGDGGPATAALVNNPGGVGVDGSGNVFIADSSNERVREVAKATGVITTVAGSGTMGFGGDGGAPTAAALNLPYAVAVDGSGNLFIADANNNRVREVVVSNNPTIGSLVAPAWTVNQPGYLGSATVTGGTAPYHNLSATGLPPGMTTTLNGSTIFLKGAPTTAGTYSNVTLSVQDANGLTGSLTFSLTVNPLPTFGSLTLAQWTAEVRGYNGYIPINGGTGPFTLVAQSNLPPGLSAVLGGNAVSFTGIPTTPGTYGNVQLTVSDATGASASGVFSITINAPAPGSILTIAGTGSGGYGGDGGPANLAQLYDPFSVAVDSSGNVFLADYFNNRIREIVKATGNIITVAGTGSGGYSGDGGPATSATLANPSGVAVDASGNLFIADNHRIREVAKATGNIITVAGNGASTDSGDGGPATAAGLAQSLAVAVDANDNIFIADTYGHRVREVLHATGTIVTLAGTGMPGYSGDNGPATAAMLYSPTGVAVDASGNVYIGDSQNNRVREVVAATGNIITFAGSGAQGSSGDGGLATAARLADPTGLYVDSAGDVLIVDTYNSRIRVVAASSGNIATVAGVGGYGYSGDGGPATSAALNAPYGVGMDGSGNLFIADSFNNAVREVLAYPAPTLGALSPTQWTVNQSYFGYIPVTGGAPPSGAFLTTSGMPPGLTASANVTSAGNISSITISGTPTAAGTYSANLTVRGVSGLALVSHTYTITINAAPTLGTLSYAQWIAGVSGYIGTIPVSGGTTPGLSLVSQANLPPGLTATLRGTSITFSGIPTTTGTYSNVQFTVRDGAGATASGTYSITINAPSPGSILTFAGNGTPGPGGDGGAANLAGLYYPSGVAVDGSGNVFIADSYDNRIREVVKATGNIITVAGAGAPVYGGDGGPATSATLYHPTGVAVDASGNIFIADLDDNRVREVVNATGTIITVAGNGTATESGDGGPATSAGLNAPEGVAVDASGNLFIADASGNTVREVLAATGTISTVAGTGTYGYSGDNGPATAALLYEPTAVAVDGSGNLFIADTYNDRIREVVQATGNIVTIAGTGSVGYSGDGGPATSAKLNYPFGVFVDGSGNVFIGDTYNSRIREVLQYSGNIVTVAGTGSAGYSGDGGPATSARLYYPNGVVVDGSGNLFIGDTDNNVVREVLASPVLGAISSTTWTVNQPGFTATIPITSVAPPSGSVVSATGLPSGLSASLSGTTITVGGTPTASGTFSNVVISLVGATGNTLASRTYTITINAAPALGTLGSATWTVGQAGYAGAIPASGGTGTLTLSSQANLPPGLTAVLSGTLVTIAGTPTTAGTYGNVQLTVQDTIGATSTGTYSITINPLPTLGSLSTTAWTANQSGFSSTVSILGGTAPYGNLTATGLPSGLSAAESGSTITVSGTPATEGTYGNIQLTVQDATGATSAGTYSITINPAPTLGAPSATVWTASQPGFSSTVSVVGGTAPYGSLVATGLPAGLSATESGNTITISGTPTTAGVYGNVQLTTQDAAGATATGTFSVAINPAPALGSLSTTAWTANQPGFSGTVSISGGTTPVGNLTATGLPAGLSATQSGNTITLSGTPTTAGTYSNIQLTVQDTTGATASGTFSITVNPAPTLGSLSATAWTVNQPGFSGTVSISGGTMPVGNLTTTGLPAGLSATLSGNTITLSGTPTTAGAYSNVQLAVQDGALAAASGTFSITIDPAPTLSSLSTTAWSAYQPGFNGTMMISGGLAPYRNLSITGLPPGLTAALAGNRVTVSGTPTATGTYFVSASVRDSAGAVASSGSMLTVAGPAVLLSLTNNPTAVTAGTAGSVTVTALDASGYVATAYQGTLSLSSSDPAALLPASYTFTAADAGTHTFTFALRTAGSQQLHASDPTTGISGYTAPITVSPAALDHLAVAAPPNSASYYSFNITVSAEDAYNNTVTGYTGTVHFASSDGGATLPADYTFTSDDQGTHPFAVTLQTPGNQTVTATDTGAGAGGTATIQDIDYVPGLHFRFDTPSATTAGVPFDVTVTALDESNDVATHYDGTVALSSNDPGAAVVVPANYTFTAADAGAHTFAGGFTLVSAGTRFLEAVDTSGGNGDSTSANITVVPAAVSSLALSGFPASTVAGAAPSFTVAGVDAYGNVVTGYSGTIHFSSTDAQAVLPPDTVLGNGTGAFSAVLETAGPQAVTASDVANPALTVTQTVAVNPASAAQFAVTAFPTPAAAGSAGTFTVTALDAYGNVATGYAGTVHFASSDARAVLPADAPLTNGTGTFSATLKTAGTQSITATDTASSGLNGTQGTIVVTPGAATSLVVGAFPSSITAGVAANVTVTARDAYGNVASGYTGTVHFTGSDPQATLPADYTFSAADQGVHTFAATLRTAGSQSLAVADPAGGVAGGSEGGITVNAAAAAALVATAPGGTTAGSAFSVMVRALDAFGNQAPGYTGTIHFTSSDPHAVLPADHTYTVGDGGMHLFAVTLTTAGNQTLAASDTGSAGVSGTQVNVTVAPSWALSFVVSGVPTVTAGVASAVTLTATDAYGNVATGYRGTAHFSSSDLQAVLPADYTFTAADAGTHSFSAVFKKAGTQLLIVQDTAAAHISGNYWNTVTAAAASRIAANYPGNITAGTAQNLTVSAYDPFGNVATGYTGTVHVTSSDAQATLPADYTFTAADAGVHTLSVTLKTAGPQGITVRDGADGFSSTVSGINVTAAAASRFTVGGFPSSVTAGTSGSLTVTAYDAYGNVATGYVGTVHLTSSDAQAGLPADYTFTGGDQGTHTFAATLKTAGTQALSVTDTANAGLTATQTGIAVVAGAASKFVVSGYPATTAGTSHSFTVTVTDAYGNRVTGYRGTVHFTSSDAQAALPGNYTFTASDNGVHTFSATLKTAGSQSLTATDTATPSFTGSQTGITVTAAAATHLVLSAPATASVGVAVSVTVTALDAYGNIATGYLGTIHFTCSDHKAVLPSDYTFVAGDGGVHTFLVTFNSSGTQTLTATDTHTGSIKGSASVKAS
jgi:hypothetical protein